MIKKPGNIFILGMGVSGISLALYLNKRRIKNFCWDDDPEKRNNAKLKKLNISKISLKVLRNCDLLVLSPGINHLDKKPHQAILLAKKLNIKITTDIELLMLFASKNFLIGVTGTNGKSTTTHFINQTLSYNNLFNSKACGNIGVPFTDLKINENDVLVVEASSYQLSKINDLCFNIAILLNLSVDHIEWHGSMKKYSNSKLRIFENQSNNCFAIISIDDINCKKIASDFSKNFNSKLIRISCRKNKYADITLNKNNKDIRITNKLSKEVLTIPYSSFKFTITQHNFQNLLAAYTAGYLLEQKKVQFLKSLSELNNLKHRIEFIAKYQNISFYNDSKSTNVSSATTALKSFKNIFWILGGREKKGGLRGIEKNLNNVMKAYCFGESQNKIQKFLFKNSIHCTKCDTLDVSINKAFNDAKKNKKNINIILSPACSSFDQFKNFEERGEIFYKLVKEKIEIYE